MIFYVISAKSEFLVFKTKKFFIRGVCWDGSKSHRRRHVSREVIYCIWYAREIEMVQFQNGSKSRSRFFTEMAHFFNHKNRDGSKKWAISVKRHVIEILSHFEIEPSRFLLQMTSRESHSMTFRAISLYGMVHTVWSPVYDSYNMDLISYDIWSTFYSQIVI